MSATTTLVAFAVLLGVLITVHEAGHFFVAKLCGVRVLTFSIGFGPRIFGFTRGDTEYRISALPLGGYVRMFGDDAGEEVPPELQRYAFLYQPFWKKSLIAIAGPVANFALPIALFFCLLVGHETAQDAVVGAVVNGEAAAQAGMRAGDRITAVNGSPIHLFPELQEWVAPRPGTPLRISVQRGTAPAAQAVDLDVTPRAAPAPTLFDRKRTVGRLGVLWAVEEPLIAVDRGGPAAHAGIKDGDKVLSVD
ncbi:MAG TPA: RIP metalloprotease RseP, partial [Myxococcota bacterium]